MRGRLLRRVMAFVQKAIARIHEPEKLEALLKDLGQKHYFYGAKPAYVDVSPFIFYHFFHCFIFKIVLYLIWDVGKKFNLIT